MIQKVKLVLVCPLLAAAEWGYSPDAFGAPAPGEDAAFSSLTGVPAQPAQQPQQQPMMQPQPMMQGGMGGFGQPAPMMQMGQPMAGGFGAQAAPMAPMLGAFGAQPMYQQAPPPMMPQQMQPQFAPPPMPSPNFGMPALDIPSGTGSLSGVPSPSSTPTADAMASILKASSDHNPSGLTPGSDKFSAPSNNPLSDAAFSAVGTVKLPEPAQPKEDPATTVVNADGITHAKNVVRRFRKLVSQNSNAVLTNSTDDLAVARGAVANGAESLEAAPNSNKQSFWPANRMESAFANFLTIALYFTIVFALVIFTERVAHSSYASRHLGNKCPHRNAKPGLSFQSLTRRTSPQYSNTFIV